MSHRLGFASLATLAFSAGAVLAQSPTPLAGSGTVPARSNEGLAPPDDALQRTRDALMVLPSLRGVEVEAHAGVVVLRGQVATQGAREAAEEIAHRAAPDALFVANGVEVAVESAPADSEPLRADLDAIVAGQLRRIYHAIPELQGLDVEVEEGVVRLTGSVATPRARERAVEIAEAREHVLFVDSELQTGADIGAQLERTLDGLRQRAAELLGGLPVLLLSILVVVFFGLIAWRVTKMRLGQRVLADSPLLQQLMRRLAATTVLGLGIVLGLDVLGATGAVGALLGTAGVVGLALGFAFRDIVENYLAGIFLALHRPFAAGDLVLAEDTEGKVIRLSSRETILMTLEGNHVQIPNAQLFKSKVVNYSRNPRRRFDFVVGIGTGEELAHAQRVGVGALEEMEGVMDDPKPFALVEAFGDSSMKVRYLGWVDQREHDWYRVRGETVRRVKGALDAHGIDLPNPIYDIDVYTEEGRRETHVKKAVEPSKGPVSVELDRDIDRQIAEDAEARKTNLLGPSALPMDR